MSADYCIFDLPIEPIEGRYSKQWADWFQAHFINKRIPYVQIGGDPGTEQPKPTEFLNPYGTFSWKFSQLRNAIHSIQNLKFCNRVVVFLHDGWFPGIEAFKYIRALKGIDIRICAFWHAGSYDDTDMLARHGMYEWVKGSEQTWFSLCDKIFVGSKYHGDRLLAALGQKASDANKIVVTGCPVEVPNIKGIKRRPLVVWPHRLSQDKRPDLFEQITEHPKLQGLEFIRTKDYNYSKEEYYGILSEAIAVVSTAEHENFGIAMVEGATLGCAPIAPNRLCYPETLDPDWLYNSQDELIGLLETVWKRYQDDPMGVPFSKYKFRPDYGQYHRTKVVSKIVKELIKVGVA